MPTDITLPMQPVMGTQRVWTRAKWTDEWTPRPGLRCTYMKLATIPQIGTATLHWIAGRVSLPGESASFYRAPLDIEHHFVKIEYQPFEAGAEPLRWYGTIEEVHERRGDRIQNVDGSIVGTKKQQFTCHELTLLLARTPIIEGWMGLAVPRRVGLAPVFNEGGRGNCENKPTDGVHLFEEYDFSIDASLRFWSSRKIVDYLLKYFQPKDGFGNPIFSFNPISLQTTGIELHPASKPLVHEWDRPIMAPHGKSLLDCLGMLFDQRAGLGSYLETIAGPNDETTYLKVFTHAADTVQLSLDGSKTIKANPNQVNLVTDGHPGLTVDVKRSSADVYTQVVCQGAPRLAVGTFSHGDKTLGGRWQDSLVEKYNAGASSAPDYAGLPTDDDRRLSNAEIRNSDELSQVFKRFGTASTFHGKVKGGNNGPEVPLFHQDDGDTGVLFYPDGYWPRHENLQPDLPLREGEDYTDLTAVKQDWEEPGSYRRPMVFMEYKNSPDKWFQIDVGGLVDGGSGANENRSWSCSVRAERKPGENRFANVFWLNVSGQPQHVIAGDDFVPLAVDEEIVRYDWRKMLVTLAIEEPRLCEARWPKTIALGVPAVRRRVIQCGDGFQLNYIAPNTVVGLDLETGGLKRCSAGGFVRDDRPQLEEIARAMHQFYSRPRIALGITKRGATKQLWLGDLVHQLGATSDDSALVDVVNSVVTEVTVSFPDSGEQPVQHWTTSRGELDRVPIRMAGM